MTGSLRTAEPDQRLAGRRVEQPAVALILVCLLLFVDVSLPVFGNSTRVLAVLIFPALLLWGGGVRTPFCAAMYALLSLYVIVPMIFHDDVGAYEAGKVLILDYFLFLAAMVLLAKALTSECQRRKLTDMLVLFALASAVVACVQRFGFVGPLGRDRWGYSTTAAGNLRGAGFLADPNFLAILLASVVPLIVSWRFARLRAPALAVLAIGLYSTNSRTGIFLAVLALLVAIAGRVLPRATRVSTANAVLVGKRSKSVILVAACLVALFAFNVGGQRDRVVQALLIEVGVNSGVRTEHAVDAIVAHERRRLLESWIDLGIDNLPFGAGIGPKTEVTNAAHNTLVTLFAQGGLVGLAIGLVTLSCLVCFVRRRTDPFAIMGAVIILGGITASYPGMVFLILPMGLADGILAARPGTRAQRRSALAHDHGV
jgi:O-antigen ligase/polysaccharide polymerase Wzy-like membrane protein